jgi:hypothetical protein
MRSRGLRFLAFLAGSTLPAASLVLACSSGGGSANPSVTDPHVGSDASIDRARLAQPIIPDASCQVIIDTPPLLEGTHVPEGTAITWSSNPPSSGAHYPVWANFQEFDKPVDLGYLVHSMEHGGVVLFYKCDADAAGCPAIVDGLRKVRDAVPTDPRCDPAIRARVIIVPDPLLDVPVAAAAWGWTYKAQCLDLPTLTDFAKAHVAQGTEDVCAAGRTVF